MAKSHRVCPKSELAPGTCRIVEIEGRSIGVYNVNGEFYAIRNLCPHQFAPLCKGHVKGTSLPGKVGEFQYGLDGLVVRCPWHGWEFDITNGKSLFNPHRCRVKAFEVSVEPEPDPSIETFPTEVREEWVVVQV